MSVFVVISDRIVDMKFVVVMVLLVWMGAVAQAQSLSAQDNNTSYVDRTHKYISHQVKSWAVDIDDIVLGFYDFLDDQNSSTQEKFPLYTDINNSDSKLPEYLLYQQKPCEKEESFQLYEHNKSVKKSLVPAYYSQSAITPSPNNNPEIDAFFLRRKLLEERDRSYVRVSFLQTVNSLQEDDFNFNIKARVHLTRSRKRLKLFIENFNEDSAKNIGTNNQDNAPSIGLEKSSKTFFGIRPRYSIGFRGIDPFVRARYTFENDIGRWQFKPVQSFQYSLKDEFSEVTEIFLDTPTGKQSLLSFVVDRGTNTNNPGMHYDGFIQWFYTPRQYAGFSTVLGANGSTKYQNTIQDNPLVISSENRVFNYLFRVGWRENIWKKWFFYEIGPGVNYHEANHYRPNYNISFRIDLFFGHI